MARVHSRNGVSVGRGLLEAPRRPPHGKGMSVKLPGVTTGASSRSEKASWNLAGTNHHPNRGSSDREMPGATTMHRASGRFMARAGTKGPRPHNHQANALV